MPQEPEAVRPPTTEEEGASASSNDAVKSPDSAAPQEGEIISPPIDGAPEPSYQEEQAHADAYSEYHDAPSVTEDVSPSSGGSSGGGPPDDTHYSYDHSYPPEPAVPSEEEEEGGPVKTFLEHLEDLRWTLVKTAGAIAVGFAVCLFAANNLVTILKWPLDRAAINRPGKNDFSVSILLGTNLLGRYRLPTNQLGDFKLPTNHVTVELTAVQISTNQLGVTFQYVPNSAAISERSSSIQIINLGPAAGFIVAFQIAFYGGVALTSPFILYFLGQFILPALKRNEKRYVLRGLAIGTVLFFIGVAFCYFFLMPMVLALSFKYSQWLGFSAEQWRAEEYIGFVCKFMLGMGLGFEQPLIILMLVKLGIFTASGLKKFRPYMVVINLVLGAVLTTPEVITQITMFIPLQLLYEASILIASYWERRDKKREAALAQSGGVS